MVIRTNRRTKGKFRVPDDTLGFEEGLHPYVARPSKFEPILTTGQKLTPAQKKHLADAATWDTETLHNHLNVIHGWNPGEYQHRSTIDPQVAERFGIPIVTTQSLDELQRKHLAAHLADIEERVRSFQKGKTKPLTPEEYKEAGVDVAPGFSEEDNK